MHLRHMVVNFICDRVDELFPMLKVSISGNYGHLRLSEEEYNRKRADGTLTDQEKEEYEEPGPFPLPHTWKLFSGPPSMGKKFV